MAQIFKNVQLVPVESNIGFDAERSTPQTPVEQRARTPVAQETSPSAVPPEPGTVDAQPTGLQQKELDRAKEEARKEGFAIGYEEGLSAAEAKLALNLSRLERVLNQLSEKTRQPLAEQETVLVEIAVAAVARLTGEKLADREHALNIVRHALSEYGDQQLSAVYLSSEDYDALAESGLQLDRHPNLRISASPKVSAGGCLIETSNGFIDARAETQIERIRSILLHAQASAKNGDADRVR